MNFKDSFPSSSKFYGQSYRPVILLRASTRKIEEFRHSNRRFIKECIILYIVRIFSSSELVEPHINPFKVRLAATLKEGAKWEVFVRDCDQWLLLLYRILILYRAYTILCNWIPKTNERFHLIMLFYFIFFGGGGAGAKPLEILG